MSDRYKIILDEIPAKDDDKLDDGSVYHWGNKKLAGNSVVIQEKYSPPEKRPELRPIFPQPTEGLVPVTVNESEHLYSEVFVDNYTRTLMRDYEHSGFSGISGISGYSEMSGLSCSAGMWSTATSSALNSSTTWTTPVMTISGDLVVNGTITVNDEEIAVNRNGRAYPSSAVQDTESPGSVQQEERDIRPRFFSVSWVPRELPVKLIKITKKSIGKCLTEFSFRKTYNKIMDAGYKLDKILLKKHYDS
jgi:hypothetical protein